MSTPLESDKPLTSFGSFSRSVPNSWRSAPVYIRDSIGRVVRAKGLLLDRDAGGRKIIVIAIESTVTRECA
jgi:hypothetical protein